jgi:hypothetical protein
LFEADAARIVELFVARLRGTDGEKASADERSNGRRSKAENLMVKTTFRLIM